MQRNIVNIEVSEVTSPVLGHYWSAVQMLHSPLLHELVHRRRVDEQARTVL